jgi:putative ABC transport system substrate-binding protein
MVRIHRALALLFALIGSGLLVGEVCVAASKQPIRIGALTPAWGPPPQVVGLRDGLLKLGYREHEQFALGVRFTRGDLTALPAAAQALVRYGVDLIITGDIISAKAAQEATDRIPIVFAGLGDPMAAGLIESFARPGGNITGVTTLDLDLGPKRLEFFHAIVPDLKRVLFPYDKTDAHALAIAKVYRAAARHLGIDLLEQAMQSEAEAQKTLAEIRTGDIDGILKPPYVALNIPGFLLEATAQQGIPTMFDASFYVEQGGLASYGPNFYETGKQAARLVDKILKGTKRADIPVEANSTIEFVINLKTAKALRLTIPPEVLYQATKLFR